MKVFNLNISDSTRYRQEHALSAIEPATSDSTPYRR